MSATKSFYHDAINDRDQLADLDCDYDYQAKDDCRQVFESEQFEHELDAAGTSHEPQRDDYADVCWLATDEERVEFEVWAAGQGWIERAAT